MPVADSGGYLPPKPPKKPRKPKSSGGTAASDYTPKGYGSAPASSPAYHKPAPSYTPPPKYATVDPKPPLSGSQNPLNYRKPGPSFADIIAGFKQDTDLPDLLLTPLGKKKPAEELVAPVDDSLPEGMQSFLERLREKPKTPKAPEGYTLGAEKLDGPAEFAFVPDRYKRAPGESDRLLAHWDLETYKAAIEDAFYPSEAIREINGMMEAQYGDQENWLRARNERIVERKEDILEQAAAAAYEGDYTWLEREHPNFSIDLPKYREQFGVTPEGILDQRAAIIAKYADDPYMQSAMLDRMELMAEHFQNLRGTKDSGYYDYAGTRNKLKDAFEEYEEKYQTSVEFGLNSKDDEKRKAAESVTKFDSPWDWLDKGRKQRGLNKDDKALIREVGDVSDPAHGFEAWSNFYGGPSKRTHKNIQEAREEARSHAMSALGTPHLPTVKQMVTYAAMSGTLDIDDQRAVEKAIDKFRNPNHPDTRAMYVAHVMRRNPEFDAKGLGLDFINEPLVKFMEDAAKRKVGNEAAAREEDVNEITDPLDAVGDAWDTMTWQGIPVQDVRPTGGGGGASGTKDNPGPMDMNQMGWTFDKLLRLNYGMAGMADTLYSLDEDGGGLTKFEKYTPYGAFSRLTGGSVINSLDEIVANPSKILDVYEEGYNQVFRGAPLPGLKDENDIVPTTFSQVIAKNAARDPEDNIYDEEWYQQVSGFVLDAGTDPLNLVGMGTVNAVLSVPTRAAKALANVEKIAKLKGTIIPTTTGQRVMSKLSSIKIDEFASPKVNHNFRVDQSIRQIGDDLSGKQFKYADDDAFWNSPEIQAATKDVVATMNAADALKMQEAKLSNDLGIEAMQDELRFILDQSLVLKSKGDLDFTHFAIAKHTTSTLRDRALGEFPVRGGRWQTDYIDRLRTDAQSVGLYDEVFDDSPLGRAAQQARDELNKLDDAVRYGTETGRLKTTKGLIEQREYWDGVLAEATEVGALKKIPRVEEYLGSAQYKKPAFDPAAEFAAAKGMTKADLFEATGLDDLDFHRAVMEGPAMYRASDPTAEALWQAGAERIANYKAQINLPGITKAKIAAANRSRIIGYEMQNQVTIEGMMRYVEATKAMKAAGRSPDNMVVRAEVQAKIEKLESLRDEVTEELNKEYGGFIGGPTTVDDAWVPENQIIADPKLKAEQNLEEFDFTNTTLEDILADSRGFTSKDAQLNAVKKELDVQIEGLLSRREFQPELQLVAGTVYRADKMLPKNSLLRDSKGNIDVDKVLDSITRNPHNHEIDFKLPEDATAADRAFMETVTGAVRSVYPDMYSIVKTEKLGYAAKVADEAPVEPSLDFTKPDWQGKKVAPSKTPGPNEKAFIEENGPRPTGAELDRRFKTLNAAEKRAKKFDSEGNELGIGEYEAEWVRFSDEWQDAGTREQLITKGKMSNDEVMRYERAFQRFEEGKRTGDKAVVKAAQEEMKKISSKYTEVQTVAKRERVPIIERETVEGGGKRTRNQEGRDIWKKRKLKEWEKGLLKAQKLDENTPAPQTPEFKQKPSTAKEIGAEAFTRSVDVVEAGLKAGTIKRVPGTMRLTIDERAATYRQGVQLEHRAEMAKLRLAELNAENAHELRSLRAKRGALTKKKKKQLEQIEEARRVAHETRKNMQEIVEVEHVLNLAEMGPEISQRMLQVHFMGMQKNLQWTHKLFDMAETAGKMLPAKMREYYANNFVRPTKWLDTPEAVHLRAMWESLTPQVIHANLTRLKNRMGQIGTDERIRMFEWYRRGSKDKNLDYEGPMMGHYDGAMDEIREIEDIWNGTNEGYFSKNRRGAVGPDPLEPFEIYRFLKDEYRPNLAYVEYLRKLSPDGKISAGILIAAIKKAHPNKVGDLLDPHTFAWHMRIAADQAMMYKNMVRAMERLFGIAKRQGVKGDVINTLESQHGWSAVDGFSSDVLVSPELKNDVEKLLKIMEPGAEHNKFSKMADTALGYWKQSMTIYNPGYYTRNGIGEMMVSWLDGVNDPKWYRWSYRVQKFEKNMDGPLVKLKEKYSALDKVLPGTKVGGEEVIYRLPRSGAKLTVADADFWYKNTGLGSTFANTDIGQGLRGLAASSYHKNPIAKAGTRINEGAHAAGEGFEDYLRRAHFLHAMYNSGATTLERAAYLAAQRVRRSHFDYTDFSAFEKSVMLRAFPFYKWTRRGAPLMIAHLFLTPGKMSVLPKAMDTISGLGLDPVGVFNDDPVMSTSDVLDDKNGNLPDYQGIAPGWVRDLFAYQISPAPDDEYANYFRIQTPQVDGLNAVLNAVPIPGTNNDAGFGAAMLTESGLGALLNPLAKAAIETNPWVNQSMDPDFPYQIYGGEYNEMNDISTLDALGTYAARSLNPVAGFLAKMSKNGQLWEPLNMGDGSYRDKYGYSSMRDLASIVTGLGFYQGKPMPLPEGSNPTAVGQYNLSDIPEISGRKAASEYVISDGPTGKTPVGGSISANPEDMLSPEVKAYEKQFKSGWIEYPDGKGWIDYPNRGYSNYGGYGYGFGGDSSTPYLSSSSSGGLTFAALIERLRAMIDQGQVYDG